MNDQGGKLDLVNIIQRHGDWLYRRALRFTNNSDEAWDLLQDTYERALRSPPPQVVPETVRAWLLTVMRNKHLDRVKSRKLRRQVPLELVPSLASEPQEEEPAWAALGVEDVRAQVDHLAPQLESAYSLHTFEGCSYAEIAHRLQVPLRTVGSRIFRARVRLRGLLSRTQAPARASRPRPSRRRRGSREAAPIRCSASRV